MVVVVDEQKTWLQWHNKRDSLDCSRAKLTIQRNLILLVPNCFPIAPFREVSSRTTGQIGGSVGGDHSRELKFNHNEETDD